MSIKGIDSQIMVTRTAELAKEASSQIKKNETTQTHLAFQTAATEAEKKISVQTLQESQESELKLDLDKESAHSGHHKGESGSEKKDEEETSSINYVPPGNNIIDIKV